MHVDTPLESTLICSYKSEMMNYMSSNPNDFDELVCLAISEKQPYAWRAAWLLSNCTLENDPRLRKYVPSLINCLKNAKDSQSRSLLNILHKMDLSEDEEGLIFDHCISIWCKINKIPSVRWSAFCLAIKISNRYPELKEEIITMTQDYYLETLSPGIKRSVQKHLGVWKSDFDSRALKDRSSLSGDDLDLWK